MKKTILLALFLCVIVTGEAKPKLKNSVPQLGKNSVEQVLKAMTLEEKAAQMQNAAPAIERLGATRDGVLRAHKRHKDGSLRDTYTYSITAPEWPAILTRLDARLGNGVRDNSGNCP